MVVIEALVTEARDVHRSRFARSAPMKWFDASIHVPSLISIAMLAGAAGCGPQPQPQSQTTTSSPTPSTGEADTSEQETEPPLEPLALECPKSDIVPPFEITEQRCRCDNYDPNKRALFGTTHLHTGLSFDASISFVDYWDPKQPGELMAGNNPYAAYQFAKGKAPIHLPRPSGAQGGEPLLGGPSRSPSIDHPADWGAVTDHAEHFGVMGICKGLARGEDRKRLAEEDSLECRLLNGFFYLPNSAMNPTFGQVLSGGAFTQLATPSDSALSYNTRLPVCENDRELCDRAEVTTWAEVRNAAEQAYDRSSECTFTSFVAYENSSSPLGNTWHRNVIFRNDRVVERPVTAIDMAVKPNPAPLEVGVKTIPVYVEDTEENKQRIAPAPTGRVYTHPLPQPFWNLLEDRCTANDATPTAGHDLRCDFLTIPHNTNLGGGSGFIPSSFLNPYNPADAQRHQDMEPLVEIYQVKGSSECRYDPRFPPNENTTTDEQCKFEILDSSLGSRVPTSGDSLTPPTEIPPRAYVRNIWGDGIQLAATDPALVNHVNPFKMGVVAGSDAHSGVMGWHPETQDWPGHGGIKDAYPMADKTLIQYGTGGFSVVWAEENSRDSIFSAMRRKETYGTSGTRITVRFFAGWGFDPSVCERDYVSYGYANGVPMGGDLSQPPTEKSPHYNPDEPRPSFIVYAARDEYLKTNLQQIQIIKVWVDDEGKVHQNVVTAAGEQGQPGVDNQTCEAKPDVGHESLCNVVTDNDFAPNQYALYYVRVLEEPVCRYSTRYCREWYGLDPLNTEQCNADLAAMKGESDAQTQAIMTSLATQQITAEEAEKRLSQLLDQEMASRATYCCSNEQTEPFVQPIIQERAWTSPIWFEPPVPAPPEAK
jgi:hypothetical protein